ncbi:MFS transporter, PAT family, beta-lactamase induction signal transducer AmpG [Gammaproteobacteria bacterium]
MLIVLLMGFASGLPLLLTGSLLQAWMKEARLDLATIGLFSLVGLPYTLKFLWAPLCDRWSPLPLGRRRGWLIIAQGGLIMALLALSFSQPQQPLTVALAALAVTFFSASQDITIDAYRRETLTDEEQGLGASLAVNGYRAGMLLAGGGGLILADFMAFQQVYWLMAGIMILCLPVGWLAPEPPLPAGQPRTLQEAVVAPFLEYFQRPDALLLLLFILLYKMGDVMASQLTTPFYLDLGFSKTEVGAIVKLFGFWATVTGGLLGGIWILRLGIRRALWWFGILQGVSTAGFTVLALLGPVTPALALAVALENFTGGLGTAAYTAFMASLTHRRFTATQYALLSSVMGVPRVLIAAPAGFLAESTGWPVFFALCVVAAAPGLLLLRWLEKRGALS